MSELSFGQRLFKWLAVAAFISCVGAGVAMAQTEPTIKQIYDAAESGKVEQAQTMVQQVLITHPNSARAHFVQAELFARQGLPSRGREALLAAEKLAPGLPFAKPDAVQALRTQLASKTTAQVTREPANRAAGNGMTSESSMPAKASSFPWGLGLALGGAAIALALFFMRKKPAAEPLSSMPYAAQRPDPSMMGSNLGGGLSGPQTFGTAGASGMAPSYGQAGSGQPGYGQPVYGQPGYGQPATSGMGGRVMGGLATGLAVGAGVIAAQAIGKSLMGNNEHSASPSDNSAAGYTPAPLAGNNDMGGQNFGMNDASSWDDASTSADAGGGDWDT